MITQEVVIAIVNGKSIEDAIDELLEGDDNLPGAIGVVKRLKKKGITKPTKSFKMQVKQKQQQQTKPNKPQANQQPQTRAYQNR